MTTLLLLRHGQAGARDDYDRLSELGRQQAQRLGDYLRAEGRRFASVISGPLRRQVETCELAIGTPAIDLRWAEFDLDAVAAAIAPRLAEESAQFRQEYDEFQQSLASGDPAVHRQWHGTDVAIVRAWIEGRFATDCESWAAFIARVTSTRESLAALPDGSEVAISTSATPIAIWIGLALDLQPGAILRLAGAMYNTGLTVLHLGAGRVELASYNSTPHLAGDGLLTVR